VTIYSQKLLNFAQRGWLSLLPSWQLVEAEKEQQRRKEEYSRLKWKPSSPAKSRERKAAATKPASAPSTPRKPPAPKSQQEIVNNNSAEYLEWKVKKVGGVQEGICN
jgi:hypothetical protein